MKTTCTNMLILGPEYQFGIVCSCFTTINYVDRCFSFFLLNIVLSVILRFKDSDYLFGILKLFSIFRTYKYFQASIYRNSKISTILLRDS